MKTTTTDAKLIEAYPENPVHGSYALRILEYSEEGLPNYEYYTARFTMVEDTPSDYTSGPSASLELGSWIMIGHGLGHCRIEDADEWAKQYWQDVNE